MIPFSLLLRKWWNWQTRYLEVVVGVISLGGSSPPFRSLFRILETNATIESLS